MSLDNPSNFSSMNLPIPSLDAPNDFSSINSLTPSVNPEIFTNNSSNFQSRFLHQIRDQHYFIEIWMYNQIDGQDAFPLPFIFIDSLVIEETILNWVTKGEIIINNDFEVFERYYENQKKAPFIFRTDGRNRISVIITPTTPLTDNISLFDGKADNNKEEFLEKWQMAYDFVIYDVEDLTTNNNTQKKKKLYLWDERYQIFSEKNIEYTTSKTTNTPDSDRCLRANLAIKEVIEEASKNPDNSIINIGYEENGGSIDNPVKPINDFGAWDDGTDDNEIFYTSPAFSTVYDDLQYLLPYAGTLDGGPVFLTLGRTQSDKRWKLRSLKDYFEKSREDQIEKLIIQDFDFDSTTKPYVPRSYNDFGSDIQNFFSGIASQITSYKFSPMVSSDDKRIVTSPSHRFDFSSGSFSVELEDHDVLSVIDKIEELGKSGLYNFTERSEKSQVLLNLNRSKKENLIINNLFSPLQFKPPFFEKNQMIKDALFLNEALHFQIAGLTIRTPGKFIFVDKFSASDENPIDDRLLGQWMIVKTKHIFTQTSYISDVLATKLDCFSKIWQKEDQKF
jgi:hypothetical protein